MLSGLAGALLAGGLTPTTRARCAAFLHGLAGRVAAAGPDGAAEAAAAVLEAIEDTGVPGVTTAGSGLPTAPISAQDLPDALPEALRSLESPAKMEG